MTRTIARHAFIALATLAAACAGTHDAEPEESQEQAAAEGETHPYQAKLVCTRAPGSTLVGVMHDISSGARVKVAEFTSAGNVGACELAIRASRNNRVCVPSGWSGFTVRDLGTKTNQGSYSTLAACTAVTRGAPVMRTEPGYVDFVAPNELAPFRAALPRLADPTVDAVLRDARTMFYDEASLTFVYQDSFGSPKGLRANRVGYDVGSTSSVPDIRALTEYFEPQKFKFPFAVTAGATFERNVYAMYFWRPPADVNGKVVPVRMWKRASHWQWVFPVGTVIGEVLFIQAPDDAKWFSFEVRSRRRAKTGWITSVFRPYLEAGDLAAAIKSKRAAWSTTPDLHALVDHLESPSSLTPRTLSAPSYAKVFPPIHGAMDYLPATSDIGLVKQLLVDRTFQDAMGTPWKTNGTHTTWAASTRAGFHVVPAEYPAGMFELSEKGCKNCHEQTSRPLNNLDPRVVLYGEVWGEDEIFTWHPFAIDESSFSVAEGNRRVNPRLVAAGLVEWGTAGADPTTYAPLPKPYSPVYE